MNSQPESKPDTNVKMEPGTQMEIDPIDRILSRDGELVPSSGFLASVMERVREEAAAPAPLPFPWKRFLPGILLLAGVFGWGAIQFFRYLPQAMQSLSSTVQHLPILAARDFTQAGWIALACVLALVSWLFAKRLAGPSNWL
jgi:hypothetical protein